jgi:DNA-binding NarL/FixJ family response regulator
VVLVDDQELVRTGFRLILDAEPDIDVVGEAGDGEEAIDVIETTRPDLVLMDVRMPKMDGIEATRRLCADRPDDPKCPKIVILTTFDIDDYVYEALRAGASGFLLKDTPADDLIAGIRVVAAGDGLLAPSVTRRLIEEFAGRNSPLPPIDQLGDLTEREIDVLRHLAQGLSNAEMAETLFVSETTIKTHVSHILTKLGLRDRVQAVVAAYESGLVQPGNSP